MSVHTCTCTVYMYTLLSVHVTCFPHVHECICHAEREKRHSVLFRFTCTLMCHNVCTSNCIRIKKKTLQQSNKLYNSPMRPKHTIHLYLHISFRILILHIPGLHPDANLYSQLTKHISHTHSTKTGHNLKRESADIKQINFTAIHIHIVY